MILDELERRKLLLSDFAEYVDKADFCEFEGLSTDGCRV